jgi:hypothetical protein
MLQFITIPLVVGIITLGIYKLFELFARRKERLLIIEKLGDKLDSSMIEIKHSLPLKLEGLQKFGTLKIACFLLGIGIGLLIGYFICLNTVVGFNYENMSRNADESVGVIYGASVLLFGGLGLLIAFLVEMKYLKNPKSEE